jgi:hypothetical protein
MKDALLPRSVNCCYQGVSPTMEQVTHFQAVIESRNWDLSHGAHADRAGTKWHSKFSCWLAHSCAKEESLHHAFRATAPARPPHRSGDVADNNPRDYLSSLCIEVSLRPSHPLGCCLLSGEQFRRQALDSVENATMAGADDLIQHVC